MDTRSASPEIHPHPHKLDQAERSAIKNHRPAVIWLTGLSGSGKSTLANLLETRLNAGFHAHTYLLDGDNLREGLNRDLGFSLADRAENIRRAGEVARLFYDAGLVVITAFISPLRADREAVRRRLPAGGFIEVYVECALEVCEQRDPKGLYRKARAGLLPDFTGISSPFEEPLAPEIRLNSARLNAEQCAQALLTYLQEHHYLDTLHG